MGPVGGGGRRAYGGRLHVEQIATGLKHIDTRGYVHLAADGGAYFYESPDRYVPIPTYRLFAAVFRDLPRLMLDSELVGKGGEVAAGWADLPAVPRPVACASTRMPIRAQSPGSVRAPRRSSRSDKGRAWGEAGGPVTGAGQVCCLLVD